MKKHWNDPDAHLWEVVDAKTGEVIPHVIFADEEAGIVEFYTGEEDPHGGYNSVRMRWNIRLRRIAEP